MKPSKIILLKLLIVFVSLFAITTAKATHVVGGEVTYRCVGSNRYEVTITTYRDCLSGLQAAIQEDNPAYVAIYTTAGQFVLNDSIYATNFQGETVPPNFKNDCVNNPPRTCLNKIVWTKTFTLNNTNTGYKIVYQRCCRNASILNIVNPANAGATYFCYIPPASLATCNNSAQFKNFPPQIICVNNPLVYDHGATDVDGDSLSYEFCQSYDGGDNLNSKPTRPPFNLNLLVFRSPYSFNNPISGNPKLQIDSKTGLITGTPNIQGRYVVSVCCKEWRGGVLINTVFREFQFVVTNCSKAVVANIPQYSSEFNTYIVNCNDRTVNFSNTSSGGDTYFWDFGVRGIDSDTSSAFEPTYTYPDSGLYVVKLWVNKNTTCGDSIERFVKVYPVLRANFSAPTIACPGDTIQFSDITNSSYEINSWLWNFDDFSAIDTNQNPTHVYPYGGLYNVGLIVTNKQKCLDTLFKPILIDPFKPFIGFDTSIVVGEKIDFQGIGGNTYKWTPTTYLSDPFAKNPVGIFTDTGVFNYSVEVKSPQTNCVGRDSITVRVLSNGFLVLPNAFTPNGDGRNDIFRPLIVGYQKVRFFRIFNRYGQLVYETNDIKGGWDGTFRGQLQVMGVYYWMVGATDRYGKDVMEKGDVTLIR